MYHAIYELNLLTRIRYLIFLQFSRMSLMVNIMMSHDDSMRGVRYTSIAVPASILMMISGAAGIIHHPTWLPLKYAKWVGLLGVMGQVMAFLSTLW